MQFLGIDVAKKKLDCILLNPATQKRKSKAVANTPAGWASLIQWLSAQGVEPTQVHIVMEPTGSYHEPAALTFSDAGCRVSLVNPAQLRHYADAIGARNKTDAADAAVLARYGATEQPPAWQPPPPSVRALRALLARRDAVAADLQREKNRAEKLDALEIPQSVRDSLARSITFLESQLATLQAEITRHIDDDPDLHQQRDLLLTIPGVGPQVAQHMTALLAGRHFDRAEQVAAYLGLVPLQRQSGSSLNAKPRLSKTGPARLRQLLYLPAVTATRCNPHIRAFYQRLLAQGKPKMAAIAASMRKLVHLCFGVLRSNTPYQHHFFPHNT